MLLAILLSVLAVVAARVLWWRWKYDLHKIPSPPGWPLLGHLPVFLEGKGDSQLSQYLGMSWKRLGTPKVVRLSILGASVLFIRDMEVAKNQVLSKTDPFPKAEFIIGPVSKLLGGDPSVKSLLATIRVTPYVKAVRRVYLNAMQTSSLKASMPKLNRVVDRMIEIVETQRRKGPIDFQKLLVKMTLDAIGVVAFDTPLGGLDGHQKIYKLLLEAGHVVRRQLSSPLRSILHSLFPFLEEAQKDRKTVKALATEWEALATDILERDDPPKGTEPLWHGLRTLIDPETGKPLPFKSLVAEVATVALAGMDTTGHQLSCILALLVDHPRVVDKVIEELEQHGFHGADGEEISLEALTDLSYLAAVVKEGMRISHIVLGANEYVVPHDMTILGYRVPKGTITNIPGTRWLNSRDEWGDPDVFRPERWLTDEDMSQKYLLGFSFGPRDCLGQKLATLEMRLAIARLLLLYTLTSTRPFHEIMRDSQDGVVIESIHGIWLHASPRRV